MSRNAIGSPAIVGVIAGIVEALSRIENRILRIVSLPDFVVESSLTHQGVLGDNVTTNRRFGANETWAVARVQLLRA